MTIDINISTYRDLQQPNVHKHKIEGISRRPHVATDAPIHPKDFWVVHPKYPLTPVLNRRRVAGSMRTFQEFHAKRKFVLSV
jgi:hypothetical protein